MCNCTLLFFLRFLITLWVWTLAAVWIKCTSARSEFTGCDNYCLLQKIEQPRLADTVVNLAYFFLSAPARHRLVKSSLDQLAWLLQPIPGKKYQYFVLRTSLRRSYFKLLRRRVCQHEQRKMCLHPVMSFPQSKRHMKWKPRGN